MSHSADIIIENGVTGTLVKLTDQDFATIVVWLNYHIDVLQRLQSLNVPAKMGNLSRYSGLRTEMKAVKERLWSGRRWRSGIQDGKYLHSFLILNGVIFVPDDLQCILNAGATFGPDLDADASSNTLDKLRMLWGMVEIA